MASSCMSTCIDDVRVPVRATYVNLYKWPESDAEFVRSVSTNGPRGGRAHANSRVADSISCRQNYLRSYKFSRKEETLHEKITQKCCFGGVKERMKSGRSLERKGISKNINNFLSKKKFLVLTRAKEISCDALQLMFRRVLSCTTKVDVDVADDHHGEIDHKFKRASDFN